MISRRPAPSCWRLPYLSVCLSVCLPVCLCVCMSVCLSVCVSVCLSVCLSFFWSGLVFSPLWSGLVWPYGPINNTERKLIARNRCGLENGGGGLEWTARSFREISRAASGIVSTPYRTVAGLRHWVAVAEAEQTIMAPINVYSH